MKVLVTGGAGFIGANLVHHLIRETDFQVVVLDKLTYAGNLESLKDVSDSSRYRFENVDIVCESSVAECIHRNQPDAIMHLAAESHVDRSIDNPGEFIQTNIVGTFNLLETGRRYHDGLAGEKRTRFRFHHVSTDEVYGSLDGNASRFCEDSPYDPHSPYSASKAASDHLVRAWHETYRLPVLLTNSPNNYGPYQFPEKLVPLVILKALQGQAIPVYGRGENVRDWLYVMDHVRALLLVLKEGQPGETYNIGGNNEWRNIEIVKLICGILDEKLPVSENPAIDKASSIQSYFDLVSFVEDRPGHDLRYAMNASKIENELGWKPMEDFVGSFKETIDWYLAHQQWWRNILSRSCCLERQGISRDSTKTGIDVDF